MATSARPRIAAEPEGIAPPPPLEGQSVPLEVFPGAQPNAGRPRISSGGRVFLLGDAVAIAASLAATVAIAAVRTPAIVNVPLVLAGCSVFGLYLAGCYDERVYHRANGLSTRLLFGLGLAVLVSSTISFFVPAVGLGRTAVAVYYLLALPALLVWRRTGGERIRARVAPIPVAVLGYGPGLQELGEALRRDKSYRVDVEFKALPNGEIQVSKWGRQAGRRPASDVSRVVGAAGIRLIAVAPSGLAGRKDVYQQLILCKRMGVEVQDIGPCVEMLTRRLPIRHVEDWWVAFSFRFLGWGQALDDRLKRLVDIALSAFGLLVASPLLLLAYLAIRLTSRGPALFRQERVGLRNQPFVINKFRTMVANAEQFGPTQPADPRITRLGRFLRRTHWDELPQLWNVLRGDMSLVGPRPEICELADEFRKRIPYYDLRHIVKPGVTGLAQIECGYSQTVSGAEAKLEYDLHYIRHRNSLWDMRILLKTLVVAASFRGSRP